MINYNSTAQLSTHFQDIFNVIVIPCLAGIAFPLKVTSIVILSIIVRENKKKKINLNMFHYMITYEILDLFQGITK